MYFYKIDGGEAVILSCRDYGGAAVIPEELDGYPVTGLAPYAFSEKENPVPESGEIRLGGESLAGKAEQDAPDLRGGRLTEIYLPGTLKTIGNYTFYNCGRLKRVHLKSTVEDIGSGVFTGCPGVSELDIEVVKGKKSCFREIISELRQELDVNYSSEEGEARLVFPEFYEESVENTPARKLSTQMHGCGHLYRNCFQQTDFLFREYDGLFPFAVAREPEAVTVRLALGRLMRPLGLSEEAGKRYGGYVREHLKAAARELLREQGESGLSWLAGNLVSDREGLDILLQAASESGDASAVSRLMDCRRGRYPVKKRRFSL